MTSTLVGYFDDYSAAQRTEQDLIEAGFRGDDVQLVSKNVDGMQVSEQSADSPDSEDNWWDRFKSAFGFADEHERTYYEQAARRGGALLTVRVPDAQTGAAMAIIERNHPVDLDQQFEGSSAQTSGLGAQTSGLGARANLDRDTDMDVDSESESIALAQEELVVGKRQVQRGAVRVHTYVSERPVQEDVVVREQEAYVDRRPVDRAATAGEAAFTERTLEVRELGEEVVVSKQARVVEEVRIGKEEISRTETVRDTVRKTEIEVERDDEPTRR